MSQPRTALHWFRRDLRLTDNTALHHATESASQVIPVYILSDWKKEHGWTGPNRQHFLCGSLQSLAKNLEVLGSRLIFRCGRADAELERLIHETGAEALYYNRDYDPYGRAMEAQVQALCERHGIACHAYDDRVLHPPGTVLTGGGQPYRVFTPYSKNWTNLPKAPALPRVTTLGAPAAAKITSLEPPTNAHWQIPEPTAAIPAAGERAARQRLQHLIESDLLHRYHEQRNTPAGQTTSGLSQDLRHGLLGIREVHQRCQEAGQGAPAAAQTSIATFIKELAWREFYLAILWHYPHVFEEEFNADWRGLPWPGTEGDFQRWAEGSTGFPIVDAGMRQLLGTGLMHNRVRMIVAMFLTKDLHCDWRLGEAYFMQQLVDGENASNNGGWQWSAGTGADAAPYFRIQNPWLQSARFDPAGTYIKQWVPELKDVPAALLHEPPPTPGVPLAPGYPVPMVHHHTERDRCLAIFAKHKQERR